MGISMFSNPLSILFSKELMLSKELIVNRFRFVENVFLIFWEVATQEKGAYSNPSSTNSGFSIPTNASSEIKQIFSVGN